MLILNERHTPRGKVLLPQVGLVSGDLIAHPNSWAPIPEKISNKLPPRYTRMSLKFINTKNDFEAAALMYRLDLDLPERKKPSELRKQLIKIGNTARKLLRLLGVKDPSQAPDGPARDVLQVLASTGHKTQEDPIIRATARVGRLVEILDAVDACREIERLAANGAKEAVEIGKLYVPRGHQGDVAVNDWIGCMLGIYQKITGKRKLGISVKAPRQRDSGKPTGPLIRFLQAAGTPLGIRLSAASLAGRIKDLRTAGRRGKK